MEKKTSKPHRRFICVEFEIIKNFDNRNVGKNDKRLGVVTQT